MEPRALLATLLVLIGVGCSSSSTTETTQGSSSVVTATVGEWFVRASTASVSAGEVTFRVANSGAIVHEFVVVKSTFAPGGIPLAAGGVFDETGDGIDIQGEIPEWPNGQARELVLVLAEGDYELVCNLPGHYASGMHTVLTVE